jgi:hypothetical protein
MGRVPNWEGGINSANRQQVGPSLAGISPCAEASVRQTGFYETTWPQAWSTFSTENSDITIH